MKQALLGLAMLGMLGCKSAGPWIVSPAEYAAYRETRIAKTLDERLAAAAHYVKTYPDGVYRVEVRGYLEQAEPVYYQVKQANIAGLQTYLRVLPSGAFSKEANRRLRALQRAERAGDPMLRVAEETEAKLADEQQARQRIRDELTGWVSRFLDATLWDKPFVEAPPAVLVPFSLALPWPTCKLANETHSEASMESDGEEVTASPAVLVTAPPDAIRCAKVIELPYTVKVEGESEQRQVTLEIAVLTDPAGRPLEVTISGPDLFVRLAETRLVRAIASDDPAARVDGISYAVDIARTVFRERISEDSTCQRPAVAPSVLDLACKGVRLSVRAAVDTGGDDVIAMTKSGD